MPSKFSVELLAPCGMNCGVCKAYLAYSRGVPKQRGKITHCVGCLIRNKNCYIKRGCKKLSKGQIKFCFECAELPCKNLARLDKRYRERYGVSLVENLKQLKSVGVEAFLMAEQAKFACPSCGDVISIHDGRCYICNKTQKKS